MVGCNSGMNKWNIDKSRRKAFPICHKVYLTSKRREKRLLSECHGWVSWPKPKLRDFFFFLFFQNLLLCTTKMWSDKVFLALQWAEIAFWITLRVTAHLLFGFEPPTHFHSARRGGGFGDSFFLSLLSTASLCRQYGRHHRTQEHLHPQGSQSVPAAGGGDGQRRSASLQHRHSDHQRVQLPSRRPLSQRGGGGFVPVHGHQPADPGGSAGLPGPALRWGRHNN